MSHLSRASFGVFTAIIALTAAGCHDNAPMQPLSGSPSIVIGVNVPAPSDPATVTDARISGDELSLDVEFGGGCSEHAFALHTNAAFLESLPVQTHVSLLHDANGDMCRALLRRTLTFDLSALRNTYRAAYHAVSGVIVIHVHAPGSDPHVVTTIRYEF